MRWLRLLLTIALLPTIASALPDHVAQEGLLIGQDGAALDGEHDLTVRIYDRERGGEPLMVERHRRVAVEEGYYFLAIGSVEALDGAWFLLDELYFTLAVDEGAEMAPRTPLRKVPAAFVADVAVNAVGDITPRTVSVGGDVVINADGQWVGDPTNLRGPRGEQGPRGLAGDAGEEGEQGSPDTPEQVRDKLIQADGAGSGVDSDLLDGVDSGAFMRSDRDTSTDGTLGVGGSLAVAGGAVIGPIRINDAAPHSYITLFRPNRQREAGLRYLTDESIDWWQFVDNRADDNDLRWRSPADGFSDRNPQLRLTSTGDLFVGHALTVRRDLTVNRSATIGHIEVSGRNNATIALTRTEADRAAGMSISTGEDLDWWFMVDNDDADNDLRWVQRSAQSFGDRNPQLRLAGAGDLFVGRHVNAAGTVTGAGVMARGDARQAPIMRARPTVNVGARVPVLTVDNAAGAPLIRLEPNAGHGLPGIGGAAPGFEVFGGSGDAGDLRLQANRSANASQILLRPNRINFLSMGGGGEAQVYMSIIGPTGRVGVATENPGAQLHVTGLRNEVVFRQTRGETSYDQNIADGQWTLASGDTTLITADAENDRVQIPSIVLPGLDDAPEEPTKGQLYLNDSSNRLFYWDGDAWLRLRVSGGGGGDDDDDEEEEEVARFIDGFDGAEGPDLSGEGYTQCYGWLNNGQNVAPSLAAMRNSCGRGQSMVFAGHRCDGQLVRHDALLIRPFSEFLVGERRFWREFDVDRRFSWHMSADWALLVRYNNNWSDPGRYWEPYIGGGNNANADRGHVLSPNGNHRHDQSGCVGDSYYLYYQPARQIQEPVRDGLIGHWPLDGNGQDVSGNGLHGRAEGGMRWVDGIKGRAARIDANDDAIRVVDDGNSPLDVRSVTMAAWVYPLSCRTPRDRGIIMNKESTWEFGLENNSCRLQGAFSPCWRWWGTAVIPTNTWTHVAIVHDGNQEIHYVNGERREATGCGGLLAVNNNDFKIGSRGGDGGNGSDFNGSIDDAYVFDRALGAEEIMSLFRAGAGPRGNSADNAAPSCKLVLEDNEDADSGVYWLDPDGDGGDNPYRAYCDMETDGGGWTMCYTTNRHHHLDNRGVAGSYGQNGYRTNCREVRFHEVMYVNHATDQKAMFRRNNGQDTSVEAVGFNSRGSDLGLWTGRGDARRDWSYQLLSCDRTWMQVGLFMSGYTNCWKQCGSWCGDRATDYYRTNGEGNGVRDSGNYRGVSFRENGHRVVADKMMSVGIR